MVFFLWHYITIKLYIEDRFLSLSSEYVTNVVAR